MKVKHIKRELKEKYTKASVLLFTLDEIANLKYKATFTPKSIIRRTLPIFKSVPTVTSNLKLLEKLGIIGITNKHTTKTRIKYTVKINPKFQSKLIYKKKLNNMAKKQYEISKRI